MEINATLFGQLITFAILVWFTMRYVWPPITNAMHDREKKIAQGLEAAERSKREVEVAEHKVVAILREAKLDASRIIDKAHKQATQLIEEAKADARTESERIIAYAQSEITREVAQAKEILRSQLASLVVQGAEKIIQRNLNASDQAALLDKFAAEI